MRAGRCHAPYSPPASPVPLPPCATFCTPPGQPAHPTRLLAPPHPLTATPPQHPTPRRRVPLPAPAVHRAPLCTAGRLLELVDKSVQQVEKEAMVHRVVLASVASA